MYCSHFGLHRPPFNNTPDPSFYYSTPDHEEAMATLQYATCHRKGFVLVTGEIGAGKTLVGRMFIRQLDREASTAVITHTDLNARQLLAAICAEFELPVAPDATNLQLADVLQEFLLEEFARDRFVVVLIDEGQNLPDESFEALRMLGNLEADDAKLLQVCILGQPELRDRFKKSSMKQLDQRLFRRFHLPALNEHQAAEYIRRRLSIAGAARDDIFTDEAIHRVFVASQGIPRVINQICDNAMLAAYGQALTTVDQAVVEQVLDHDRAAQHESETSAEPGVATRPAAMAAEVAGPPAEAPAALAVAEVEPSSESATRFEGQDLASAPTHEDTEARIERIYGSRPILTSTVCLTPDADRGDGEPDAGTIARREHLKEILAGVGHDWDTTRDEFESYRKEIQTSLDEVADRCRLAESQIEEITRTSIVDDEIRDLRESHMVETGRLMNEISHIRSEFQLLFEQGEQRWNHTRDRLNALLAEAVTDDALADLQNEHKKRIEETLTRLESYRQKTDELIEGLRRQCDQTQNNLAAVLEDHARSRAELNDRLDHHIAQTQEQMEERFRSVVSTEDLQKLQEAHLQLHSALKQQVASHVTEARQSLEDRIQHTAEALKSLRESQEQIRTVLHQDVQTRTEQSRQELEDRFVRTDENVALLQASQQHLQASLREELQVRVNSACETLQGQIEGAAKADDLADLSDEVTAVHKAHKMAIVDLALEADAARHEHDAAIGDLGERVDQVSAESRAAIGDLGERVDQVTAESRAAIDELIGRLDGHENEIQALSQDVAVQFKATSAAIEALRERAATVAELEAMQNDHQSAVAGILSRFDEKSRDLEAFKVTVAEREAQASEAQRTAVAELAARIDDYAEHLQGMRRQVVQHLSSLREQITTLREQSASRTELDELRETHAVQAADIVSQIEKNREAVQELIDAVAHRCQMTQERLTTLAAAADDDQQQLAQFRQSQAEDVASLLRQLEEQRLEIARQFEEGTAHWNQVQKEIQTLRETAAAADALEELRQRQSRYADEMLGTLTDQRRHLEGLVEAVDRRCDELLARIDTLPPEIATPDDIRALHEENQIHKAALDTAVRRVGEQCDRMQMALSALENRTASAAEVREIRELQSKHLSTFEEQVGTVKSQREKDVRLLVDVVQRLTERVKQLEALDRPQPVMLEMQPAAARSLAEMIAAADDRTAGLRELLGTSGTVSDRLTETSARVESVLQHWMTHADDVRAQSDQLRSSAKTAANILRAMRKCQDAINEKLKSERWQTELGRAESLTARLEAATHEAQTLYQQLRSLLTDCRDESETWLAKRDEAGRLTEDLSRLIHDSKAARGRFVQLMAAIAANTSGIAKAIDSARQFDEAERPTHAPRAKSQRAEPPAVSRIVWQELRTHPGPAKVG